MRNADLSVFWHQHVIPTCIGHVLVSGIDGRGSELIDVASRVALPGFTAVTLCCRPHGDGSGTSVAECQKTAAALRKRGVLVFLEPGVNGDLQDIVRIDGSRSIDLIVLREHESFEDTDWHGAASLRIVRRLHRPVIACGPFSSQNQSSDRKRGPVLAAVSMRESSQQVVHSAGRIGKLIAAPLTVLHAVDIAHEASRPDSLAGVDCEIQLLGNWVSAFEVAATSKIAYGPVTEAITRFAAKANASLIVMGVDLDEKDREAERSDTLRRAVLMGAPCPVLFVPTIHKKVHKGDGFSVDAQARAASIAPALAAAP